MPWTCPKCKRPFKHRNQSHSCVRVNVGSILKNKNPDVVKCYEKLADSVCKLGADVKITCALKAVFAKAPSTFLAMKPKTDHLAVEFFLADEINEFPVEKTFRVSKNRVAHFVRVQFPAEVDGQLLGWIKRAYELMRK